jgi:hypothetical protein
MNDNLTGLWVYLVMAYIAFVLLRRWSGKEVHLAILGKVLDGMEWLAEWALDQVGAGRAYSEHYRMLRQRRKEWVVRPMAEPPTKTGADVEVLQ